jgi:hypothetical protein
MYNTIEDYDENEFEKYEDDLDDEVEAMYFEEEPESEDDYDGEFIGNDGTPDRSVLLSVNDNGATLDDVQSDMKNRMRSFPQETSGPKDIAVIMSQGSNPLSLMPANVQMMQPTLISLDNDSFIEGKIYKKGTVLEIFTEAYGSHRDDYQDVEIQKQARHDQFKRDEMEAELDHEDNPGYHMNKSSDNKHSDYKEPVRLPSGLDASQTNDFKRIILDYGNSMNQYIPKEYQHLITDYRNGKKFDAEQTKKLIKYMYSMDLI